MSHSRTVRDTRRGGIAAGQTACGVSSDSAPRPTGSLVGRAVPSPPQPRLLVVGSSNTDLVIQCDRLPQPGETLLGGEFARYAGGKGANQAVAAARAGARVTFVGAHGDDLGMQTGPQMSPAMYREFFKPRHARLWQRAKELAPHIKVLLHCCGGVRELLPDLIDAGLDAINPVQITCQGMDAGGLKRDFGKDLTFWGGGCDTRSILPHSSPADVAKHVRQQVQIMNQGGGFVFQQVHNIMANVPPANIVAMLEEVAESNG